MREPVEIISIAVPVLIEVVAVTLAIMLFAAWIAIGAA